MCYIVANTSWISSASDGFPTAILHVTAHVWCTLRTPVILLLVHPYYNLRPLPHKFENGKNNRIQTAYEIEALWYLRHHRYAYTRIDRIGYAYIVFHLKLWIHHHLLFAIYNSFVAVVNPAYGLWSNTRGKPSYKHRHKNGWTKYSPIKTTSDEEQSTRFSLKDTCWVTSVIMCMHALSLWALVRWF